MPINPDKWVRVSLAGVGKWSQAATAPLPEGAKIVHEDAADGSGGPLPDEPDPPTDFTAIRTGAAWGVEPKPASKPAAHKSKEA
jgi:hypothetical protein